MSEFDFGAYGTLVNITGQLIRETEGIYSRDVEYDLETGRADPAVLASLIDAPKRVLEQREKELSSVKPPKELKGFHHAYEKGVRATILRWGCIRRAALGSAQQMQVLTMDQFGRASLELKPLARTHPALLAALRLDSMLIVGVLWKDIDWREFAVITQTQVASSAKICGSCGHHLDATAKFCPECGLRLG